MTLTLTLTLLTLTLTFLFFWWSLSLPLSLFVLCLCLRCCLSLLLALTHPNPNPNPPNPNPCCFCLVFSWRCLVLSCLLSCLVRNKNYTLFCFWQANWIFSIYSLQEGYFVVYSLQECSMYLVFIVTCCFAFFACFFVRGWGFCRGSAFLKHPF